MNSGNDSGRNSRNLLDLLDELRELSSNEQKSRLDELGLDPGQRAELENCLRAQVSGSQLLNRLPGQVEKLMQEIEHSGQPSTQTADAADEHVPGFPPIGSYRIVRLLGRGGMGDVYEAVQRQPRRTVALKVLRAGIASEKNRRRAVYEAEVLGRMQHPGIAHIYESGIAQTADGPQPYFAMEIIRGQAGRPAPMLTQYADQRKLGTRQRMQLLAKVADAVHYAHMQGIIHRDLKPANVLVTEDGEPKVVDFGVARITDSDVQAATIQTDLGQVIGTLAYMSPEQAGGDPAQIDLRTDVYGLGAIAYELLAGRAPLSLDRAAIHEAVRAIHEQEPASLSSIERSLRGDVETIVGKALAKEKQRRYSSAAELAADVRRYLADEPILARPASVRYQLGKFARRNRALVCGAAAVILVLLAGIVTTTWQARVARRQAAAANAAKSAAETAQAETRRQLVTLSDLASQFTQTYDEIAALPGSAAVCKRLVATAMPYLDAVARSLPDDPDVQYKQMLSYYSVAEADANVDPSNPSQIAQSLDCCQRAVAILDRLLQAHPEDPNLRIWKPRLLRETGLYYHTMEKNDQSIAMLRQGLEDAQALQRDLPGDIAVGHVLRDLTEDYGRVLGDTGLTQAALVLLRRARQMSAEFHALEQTPQSLVILAGNCRQIAHLEGVLAHYPAALQECREGLKLLESQFSSRPDARLMRLTWALRDKAAHSQIFLHQALEAYDAYPNCLSIVQDLARDHENLQAQRDLAQSYSRFGQLASNIFEFDEAVGALSKAREILRKLAETDPLNTSVALQLTDSDQRLGVAYGIRAELSGESEAMCLEDIGKSKQMLTEGRCIAVQCHLKGDVAPVQFDKLLATNRKLIKLAGLARAERGLTILHQPHAATGTALIPMANSLCFRIIVSDGVVEWRQLSDQFWEARHDGVLENRYRAWANYHAGKRNGIILRVLIDPSHPASGGVQVFVPLPLTDGATMECRDQLGEKPWEPLATIDRQPTPPEPRRNPNPPD